MAESVLRLHRSVYVVFFIVLLPQQRPSRSDDDQPSTDPHHRPSHPLGSFATFFRLTPSRYKSNPCILLRLLLGIPRAVRLRSS
jgi:hypothetical protein